MRVAFTKHWNEYKRGEEIDVRWDRAMYLFKCGLVRWIDRPEKIATADLMAEHAMAPPAAENADARPKFTGAGYSPRAGAKNPRLPRGGTGQSRSRKKAKK